MQDAHWGYSKDHLYPREGEGHRIGDREELNLMQSQQSHSRRGTQHRAISHQHLAVGGINVTVLEGESGQYLIASVTKKLLKY